MLMRVIGTRIGAQRWPQFAAQFRRVHTHSVPGRRARWLLRDLDDADAGFLIILWESEEQERDFIEQVELRGMMQRPIAGEIESHWFEVRSYWCAAPGS